MANTGPTLRACGETEMRRTYDEHLEAERQAALDAVLDSPAVKKLIVAGPGTGKPHAFKEAL